jgi:hypothetical protein
MAYKKTRTLKDGRVFTAEDVMRVTGLTSKQTAIKRMDMANTDEQMLTKKGVHGDYGYCKNVVVGKKKNGLEMFSTKNKREKYIRDTRPYYDSLFRLVLRII